MRDIFKLQRNGATHRARRYLREADGVFYQSLFYENQIRCDPIGYPGFSVNEPAMQVAASLMFDQMLAQCDRSASGDPLARRKLEPHDRT
jgi:hypothetical protein